MQRNNLSLSLRCMSTQNGSHLEIWCNGILIHTIEFKLWHFEVSSYVSIGRPCICNVFRPRVMWGAGLRAHKRDDLYHIWSKLDYRLPACIVWLYNAFSLTLNTRVMHTCVDKAVYANDEWRVYAILCSLRAKALVPCSCQGYPRHLQSYPRVFLWSRLSARLPDRRTRANHHHHLEDTAHPIEPTNPRRQTVSIALASHYYTLHPDSDHNEIKQ